MVEAMVSALILSIAVVGAFATMASQKAPAVESNQRVEAALVAKQFLEDLRSKVDATTYDAPGGPFDPNANPHDGGTVVGASGITYTLTYTVTAAGSARKVDLNIDWP